MHSPINKARPTGPPSAPTCETVASFARHRFFNPQATAFDGGHVVLLPDVQGTFSKNALTQSSGVPSAATERLLFLVQDLRVFFPEVNAEIREKAASLQALLPTNITLETFLATEEDPGIDQRIAAAEVELQALQQTAKIRAKALLTAVTIPALPVGLAELLATTVDGIARDAETRVNDQVEAHAMHERGQTWLSEGVGYVRNESCPFCGQSLAPAAQLIAAYRAFFSERYRRLRDNIDAMRTSVEYVLGDRQIASIERILDQNNAGVEFWSRFCVIAPPIPPDTVGDKLRALRDAALDLLGRKTAAPLETVVPGDDFRAAVAVAEASATASAAYNKAVATANAVIGARKIAAGTTDIATASDTLAILRLRKKRYESEVNAACLAYQTAVEHKGTIEKQKRVAKNKLNEHTKTVLERYAQTVNLLLGDFHTGFRITKTEHGYPGGIASSSYQILINSIPVELGDDKTPLNKPSFRNTLSSGDKSTLALAFFIAQLEHDPDKTEKIVVFDDPFNSQDAFRKDHTVRKIRDIGETCAQVMVFSHDLHFLKRLWERLQDKPAERKCLELKRIGLHNTSIVEWDIEGAVQSTYRADRQALTDFYHEGTGKPREVVQRIRPVLETYGKILGAGMVDEADTLGVIVSKIRATGQAHQLYSICDGLEDLNTYTRRYHHGENPQAATEPISDGELHSFVKRTLEMTGGC